MEDEPNTCRRGAGTPPVVSVTSAADPPGGSQQFRLGNRPPLTGIRSIGVSLLLIYHSNFRTLPGAWVALGVFFVLSGFLITAMLASEGTQTGRVSLKSF
jgi:peptidoglycan/LPS O-acetylase OafA/YrhL